MIDVVAAVGTALGGGGIVKLIDWWSNRNKNKFDQNKEFRDELRERIDDLEAEVATIKSERQQLKNEAEQWKQQAQQMYFEFKQFELSIFKVLTDNGIPADDYRPNISYPKL
jgi:hypothetical protein